jgi:hypothetical protein
MRHKAAVFAVTVVGFIVLSTGWACYRNSRLDTRFPAIRIGASEGEIQRLLGTPSWTEPCGKSFGGGPPRPNCTEYIYRNSFAPLIPEYYAVRLDNGGHVMDTYVYESP